METPKDLQELMDLVDNVFECNDKVYWKLKDLPIEKHDNEIISHSSRHLSKSAGKFASICEAYEHGNNFDAKESKDVVLSALATILKISSRLGMKASDLLDGVPKIIKPSTTTTDQA